MKYRFIFDSYGRFIYEEEDEDFIVRFKVISWDSFNYNDSSQLYFYSGSVCADDVKHDSEIIVREDEFIHNL